MQKNAIPEEWLLEDGVRLLVIDDSEDDYILCRYRLKQIVGDSFDFIWAERTSAGRNILEQSDVDCIICDFQMPGEDGLSFLQWLRSQGKQTPLIFFTGQGNERIAAKALKYGADDYFTKNHEFAQFERLANSIISATRTYRHNQQLETVSNLHERISDETIYLAGEQFSQRLAELLASELDHRCCLLLQLEDEETLTTVAGVLDGNPCSPGPVDATTGPYAEVLKQLYFAVERGAGNTYPSQSWPDGIRPESFAGICLFDSSAKRLGVLCLMDDKPNSKKQSMIRSLFSSLASRVAVEIERGQSVALLEKSTAFYSEILDDQTDPIVRYDINGQCTYSNQSFARLHAIDREDIVGSNVFDLLVSDDPENLKLRITRLTPGNALARSIRQLRVPGGEVRTLEWTDRALFNDDGELLEILSVGHDITEVLKAERKTREVEEFYQALFNAAGDAIFTMKDGRFIVGNSRAKEMFGIGESEFEGIHPSEVSPEYQPDGMTSMAKAEQHMKNAQSKTVSFEWLHKRKNGEEFQAQVTLSRFVLEGEDHLLAIVRDLDELRRKLSS